MAKKEKNNVYTTIFPNAVTVRGHNKHTAVVRVIPKTAIAAPNVIFIKSLTAITGPKAGVRHKLSKNKRIKYTHIGLSNEAIIELHHGLGQYIENIINKT